MHTYLGLGFDAAMQWACAGQALDLLLQLADAVCQSVECLHQLSFVLGFHRLVLLELRNQQLNTHTHSQCFSNSEGIKVKKNNNP